MRNKFENLGVIRHGPTSSGHPWFFLDVDIKGWTPAQRRADAKPFFERL
jgi:hypothetical protein